MTYNEYAQVLEAKNPATGKLYQPTDFNVINWNDVGTAMLQDAIWANTEQAATTRRTRTQTVEVPHRHDQGLGRTAGTTPEECRDMVVAKGSKLGKSHQLWQMNEVNKLIWPSADGIGMIDEAAWNQTVDIAMTTKNQVGDTVLTKKPEGLAYTNDYVQKAVDAAKAAGVDVLGTSFAPQTVTLTAGGA